MLIRIVLIVTLLVVVIVGGWAAYTSLTLKPIRPVVTFSSDPGAIVEIHISDFIGGDISEYHLKQISGSAVTIKPTDGGYRVELPRQARGEQLSLQLSAVSAVSQVAVTINVVTTFIGKINDIVIGNDAQCILDQYGPFCWGGDGSGQSSQIPARFTGNAKLLAGNRFFCGIEGNHLTCWGDITADVKLRNLTAIDAGGAGVCLIDSGAVQCYSSRGNQDIIRNLPRFPLSERAVISVGLRHACILDSGAVYCWGEDRFGQTKPPVDLIYPTKLISGDTYSCALDSGQIRCWGRIQFETRMPSIDRIDDIKANGTRMCALANNTWHCWVSNSGRSIRYRKTTYPATDSLRIFQAGICSIEEGKLDCENLIHPIPHTVKRPHHLRQNGHIACFVDQGKILCVGQDPGSMQRYVDVAKRGQVDAFDFDTRYGRSCARFTNGITQCFGSMRSIQPPRIEEKVTDFDLNNVMCFLSGNKAECFGDDLSRNLSNPPFLVKPEKIKVSVNQGMGSTIKSSFACAIDQNQLKCWGDDVAGQLNVPQLANPVDFDLFVESGCAISKTDSACWGNPKYLPKVLPKALTDASSLSLLYQKSCVIDEGRPVCVPAREDEAAPAFLDTVYELKAGISKNCAINASGVTCWGDQYFRYGIEYSEDNKR